MLTQKQRQARYRKFGTLRDKLAKRIGELDNFIDYKLLPILWDLDDQIEYISEDDC